MKIEVTAYIGETWTTWSVLPSQATEEEDK